MHVLKACIDQLHFYKHEFSMAHLLMH